VFAHELGHLVHRDIPVLIAIQAALAFVGLFVTAQVLPAGIAAIGALGIADVAGLPIVVLVFGVVSFVGGPAVNALTRHIEREADAYALRTTNDPTAFIAAMTRLANQNLAEYRPPASIEILYYDHPSIGKRVDAARQFAAAESG
jgi:STE24 endopeptidase